MTETSFDQWLVLIAAVLSTMFAVGWIVFAPWYKTEPGRAFVLSELSLAALLDLSVVANRLHWNVPLHVVTGILVFIVVTAFLRLMLVRLQIGAWYQRRR